MARINADAAGMLSKVAMGGEHFSCLMQFCTQQVSDAPVQWSGVSMPTGVSAALSSTFVTLFMPAREELKVGPKELCEGYG